MIADFRTLQASFVQIMRVLLHLRLQDCSLARADQDEELIREARRAAQRVCELGLECQTQREAPTNGWRNMWIALVVIGVILLFVRLQF